MQRHIFISYSKKDSEFSHRLADDLIAAGHKVWIDRSLKVGEQWENMIERQLEEAQEVIVILSPNGVASRWVQHEGSMAYGMKKTLLPVLLAEVDQDDLPLWAGKFQYHNFVGEEYQNAFDSLNAVLQPPNPMQDLLEQQVETYQRLGTLLGEAMYALFDENRKTLHFSPAALELMAKSLERIEARQQEIQSLQAQVQESEKKRREFFANIAGVALAWFLVFMAISKAASPWFSGDSGFLASVSLLDLIDVFSDIVIAIGIPMMVFLILYSRGRKQGLAWRDSQNRRNLFQAFFAAAGIYLASFFITDFPIATSGQLASQIRAIADPVWFYLVVILMFSLLAQRRGELLVSWRITILGVVGGALLTVVLAQPVMVYVYRYSIPGMDIGAVEQWLLVGAAGMVLLALGVAAARWLRPASGWMAFLSGAAVGGVAGTVLYGMLTGTAAGFFAQRELYGVAFSRVGYDEIGFTIKIANSISSAMLLSVLVFTGTILVPILLTALVTWLAYSRREKRPVSFAGSQWPLTALLSVIQIQVNFYLIFVMFALLLESIENIYRDQGVPLNLDFRQGFLLYISAIYLVLFGTQLVGLLWLRKQSRQEGQVQLITLAYLIGFLGIGFSLLAPVDFQEGITVYMVLNVMAVLLYLGYLLTGVQLHRTYLKGRERLENKELLDWMQAGLGAGFLNALISLPLIVIALSLVLISIVLIPEMPNAEMPPPGIEWLLASLDPVWSVVISATVGYLMGSVLANFFFAYLISRWPWKWVMTLWNWITKFEISLRKTPAP